MEIWLNRHALKRGMTYVFFVFLMGGWLLNLESGASAAENLRQWDIVDIPMELTEERAWSEFPVQGIFTHEESGTKLVLDAFYDGGRRWVLRFTPTLPGAWNYRGEAEEGLLASPVSGELEAIAPSEKEKHKNPLLCGALRVDDSGHYLEFSDGTPFLWFGDTFWSFNNHRANLKEMPHGKGFYEYLALRKREGMNVIQAMFFSVETPNESGYVFPAVTDKKAKVVDLSELNAAHFRELDFRMDYIRAEGFVFAAHPEWISQWTHLSLEQAEDICRYLMARYGAHNIVFSLSGEYQECWHGGGSNWSESMWNALGRSVQRHNPFDRLVTIHPSSQGYMDLKSSWGREYPWTTHAQQSSSGAFHDEDWLDMNWTQTGHRPQGLGNIMRSMLRDSTRVPVKPVVQSEAWYEDWDRGGLKKISESQLRWQFYVTFLNGGAGYTFGSLCGWRFNNDDVAPDHDKNFWYKEQWWEYLESAPRSATLHHCKDLLEGLGRDWRELVVTRDTLMLEGKPNWTPRYMNLFPPHAAAIPGVLHVVYIPEDNAERRIGMTELGGQDWVARWYDPRTGEFQEIADGPSGVDTWEIPMRPKPENSDWVLVLKAANKEVESAG